jgi:hypothetical protein
LSLQVLALQGDVNAGDDLSAGAGDEHADLPGDRGAGRAPSVDARPAGTPEKLARVAKINAFHVSLFADFLEKLQATPDGDGSPLDHSNYLYGSGMGNGRTSMTM